MPDGALLTGFDVRSEDPEFANHELRSAYVDFAVGLSGSTEGFEFVHSGVAAPGFAIVRMRYSMAARLDALALDSTLMVQHRRGGYLSVGAGRDHVVVDDMPVLMPSDRDGWWVEMEDLDERVVVVQRSAVDRVAGSFGIAPEQLVFTGMTPISHEAARYWHNVVDHVWRSVIGNEAVWSEPLVVAETGRSLAAAAVMTFANSGLRLMEQSLSSGTATSTVLRRALAFIDEQAGEDIGVEEIAAAARIGVRALQAVFRRERDRTPLEELRRVRLARAHADLQAGDPGRGDTVAAIAARWGFSNPGRFSLQYRQEYGRSPSDTLRA